MKKPLVRSGNSLALIIDKPFRTLLGLGPSRVVNVITDGRRLIVEAVPESQVHEREAPLPPPSSDVPPRVLIDARNVARQLVELHQMTDAELRRLYPKLRSIGRYLLLADTIKDDAELEVQRAMHRMHVCHEQLVAGRPWSEAIVIAEYLVPHEAGVSAQGVQGTSGPPRVGDSLHA